MSARTGDVRRRAGTRFRLFTQPPFLKGHRDPETVEVSPPPGSVGPGPSDERMYVVYPDGKPAAYGWRRDRRGLSFMYLPPWDGPIRPPAEPGADGHFDHLRPGTPAFEMAHLFGTVRFVLDVWEGYFGGPIPWHFRRDYARLELSLLPIVDNAFMGYGFLETGADVGDDGILRPFSLNFDIIAHEVGHAIIYSVVGLPAPDALEGEYFGFHEAAADIVALVAVTHFESVVDDLLETTRGNLYTLNKLNRIGELSRDTQIRNAGNGRRLSAFSRGWSDEHDLSEPLTGAIFDILVDVFHEELLDRGLIAPEVEDFADKVERVPAYAGLVQALFDEAYAADPAGFRDAFIAARHYLGRALAGTLQRLSADSLNYDDVGAALLAVDRVETGGRYARLIRRNLLLRDIGRVGVGPRLTPAGPESHAFSDRASVPDDAALMRPLSYNERWIMAREGRAVR